MLTRERLMRLITAKSGGEAVKVLEESGWSPFDPDDLLALEREIDAQRAQSYTLLEKFLPDPAVMDIFRLRFDYHNIKVLVKSVAMCLDERALLSPAGTIPLSRLEALFREEAFDSLDEVMAQAVRQAIHELKATGDPQRSDLILDQACWRRCLKPQSG
jgi:V/A-type H+-transporting ATPase subunit C